MTTDLEVRKTIKTLDCNGVPKRDIARQLEMSEGNVRYHLRRMSAEATDGRTRQRHKAADWGTYMNMIVAGEQVTLQAFHMTLSHSRYATITWPPCRTYPSHSIKR